MTCQPPDHTSIALSFANYCPDVTQQFYDLCNLLSILTPPAEDHAIVFNGDFVDRGSWSVEVALTLFAYKWLYPKRIFLNRGNHETSDMNKVYGFEVSLVCCCVCRWGRERVVAGAAVG